jgi:hypothetical protein
MANENSILDSFLAYKLSSFTVSNSFAAINSQTESKVYFYQISQFFSLYFFIKGDIFNPIQTSFK